MTPQELVEQTAVQCDSLRIFIQKQTTRLTDLDRRLKQIVQQLRKNIEVRDTEYAQDGESRGQIALNIMLSRSPEYHSRVAPVKT